MKLKVNFYMLWKVLISIRAIYINILAPLFNQEGQNPITYSGLWITRDAGGAGITWLM